MAAKTLCVVALLVACLIQGHGANPLFGGINDLVKGTTGAVSSVVSGGVDLVNLATRQTAPIRSNDIDADVTKETRENLRKQLDELLERIKDAIDHGKVLKDETLKRLKDLREKLRDMREDVGVKARELITTVSNFTNNAIKNAANFATNAVGNVNEQVNKLIDDATDIVSGASVNFQ